MEKNQILYITIQESRFPFFLRLKLRVDNLIKLHIRCYKFLSNHFLDLAGCTVKSKVIHFIFPLYPFCHSFVDRKGRSQFVSQNIAEVGLMNFNPEIFIILLLILLFEKFIKMIEA